MVLIERDSHHRLQPSTATPEAALGEFERALRQLTESSNRWSVELHTFVDGTPLLAQDISILHIIGIDDRPKSVIEISKFLNRKDSANVLYGLRKLEHTGLIEAVRGTRRRIGYILTDPGREAIDRQASIRRTVLLNQICAVPTATQTLENVVHCMWALAGFYEQAVRDLWVMGGLPRGREQSAALKPRTSQRHTARAKTTRR